MLTNGKVDEWELSDEDVLMEEVIKEGGFGKVYRGHVKGPVGNPKLAPTLRNKLKIPVAIKLLKGAICSGLDLDVIV